MFIKYITLLLISNYLMFMLLTKIIKLVVLKIILFLHSVFIFGQNINPLFAPIEKVQNKRIDSLNTVLEETVSTTQDIFNRNDATIRELEKRIEDLREINKNRKKFQEDQNTMIEYEVQKIINLVEFVKPKK